MEIKKNDYIRSYSFYRNEQYYVEGRVVSINEIESLYEVAVLVDTEMSDANRTTVFVPKLGCMIMDGDDWQRLVKL